jgi:hypothetical protein
MFDFSANEYRSYSKWLIRYHTTSTDTGTPKSQAIPYLI